jgi:hypothetical protein
VERVRCSPLVDWPVYPRRSTTLLIAWEERKSDAASRRRQPRSSAPFFVIGSVIGLLWPAKHATHGAHGMKAMIKIGVSEASDRDGSCGEWGQ